MHGHAQLVADIIVNRCRHSPATAPGERASETIYSSVHGVRRRVEQQSYCTGVWTILNAHLIYPGDDAYPGRGRGGGSVL